MSGGVVTGSSIWEWDGTNAVLLSANSVERKPGATGCGRARKGNSL